MRETCYDVARRSPREHRNSDVHVFTRNKQYGELFLESSRATRSDLPRATRITRFGERFPSTVRARVRRRRRRRTRRTLRRRAVPPLRDRLHRRPPLRRTPRSPAAPPPRCRKRTATTTNVAVLRRQDDAVPPLGHLRIGVVAERRTRASIIRDRRETVSNPRTPRTIRRTRARTSRRARTGKMKSATRRRDRRRHRHRETRVSRARETHRRALAAGVPASINTEGTHGNACSNAPGGSRRDVELQPPRRRRCRRPYAVRPRAPQPCTGPRG